MIKRLKVVEKQTVVEDGEADQEQKEENPNSDRIPEFEEPREPEYEEVLEELSQAD
jgi:hypothetical protein